MYSWFQTIKAVHLKKWEISLLNQTFNWSQVRKPSLPHPKYPEYIINNIIKSKPTHKNQVPYSK